MHGQWETTVNKFAPRCGKHQRVIISDHSENSSDDFDSEDYGDEDPNYHPAIGIPEDFEMEEEVMEEDEERDKEGDEEGVEEDKEEEGELDKERNGKNKVGAKRDKEPNNEEDEEAAAGGITKRTRRVRAWHDHKSSTQEQSPDPVSPMMSSPPSLIRDAILVDLSAEE